MEIDTYALRQVGGQLGDVRDALIPWAHTLPATGCGNDPLNASAAQFRDALTAARIAGAGLADGLAQSALIAALRWEQVDIGLAGGAV